MTDIYRARNISELHVIIEKRIEGETDQQLEDRLQAVHGDFSDQAIQQQLESFFGEHNGEHSVDYLIKRNRGRDALLGRYRSASMNSTSLLTERARSLADKLEEEARAAEEE